MLNEIYEELKRKMQVSLDKLGEEFSTLRSGRASPALLKNVRVEAYGTIVNLNEVALVTTPDPRTIMVQPYDPSIKESILKAIQKANLGFNPAVQGNNIRISVPPLTVERRKELVKKVKELAEKYRVAIRNVRREGVEEVKRMEKNKELSEDERKEAEKEIQKITDEYIKKLEEMLKRKEKEILEDSET